MSGDTFFAVQCNLIIIFKFGKTKNLVVLGQLPC